MNPSAEPGSRSLPIQVQSVHRDDRYSPIRTALQACANDLERLRDVLQETVDVLEQEEGIEAHSGTWRRAMRQTMYQWFLASPAPAVDQWLMAFADTLAAWDLESCRWLTDEPFPFPPSAAFLRSVFRNGLRGLLDGEFYRALEMLTVLIDRRSDESEEYLLRPSVRAGLLILMGRVYLTGSFDSQVKVPERERTAVTSGVSLTDPLDDQMPEQNQENARRCFEQAAAASAPDDGRADAAFAEYFRWRGERAEALRWCERAIKRSPQQPDGYLVRGVLFEDEALWYEAELSYQEAIDAVAAEAGSPDASDVMAIGTSLERLLAPVSGAVYVRLARSLKDQRPANAGVAAMQALRHGPANAQRLRIEDGAVFAQRMGYLLLGDILATLGRPMDAAAALVESGRLFLRADGYQLAAELFSRAGELDSGLASAHWYRAESLLRLSLATPDLATEDRVAQLSEVLTIWDHGCAIGPPSVEFFWAYLSRAQALQALADLQPDSAGKHLWEGCVCIEQALLLEGQAASFWSQLARFHTSLHNTLTALDAADQALRLDPNQLDALMQHTLLLAVAADAGGLDGVQRLRDLSSHAATESQSADRAVSIAQAADVLEALMLYQLEDYGRALSLFDPVLERSPDDLSLRLLRGQARRRSGDRAGANDDFSHLWEERPKPDTQMSGSDRNTCAEAGNELGHYAEAAAILTDLLDHESASVDPLEIRVGLVRSSLGLGKVDQADHQFDEALARLGHRYQAEAVRRALSYCETPSFSEQSAVMAALERYRAILVARADDLPGAHDSGAAEIELLNVLRLQRPEPGSAAWLAIHAGLARMAGEAAQWDRAADLYLAIQRQDAEVPRPRFPEASVAARGAWGQLAREAAQRGFAASRRSDLPETLEHFNRSLEYRRDAGLSGDPQDVLDEVVGVICSEEQRRTLETALQELAHP